MDASAHPSELAMLCGVSVMKIRTNLLILVLVVGVGVACQSQPDDEGDETPVESPVEGDAEDDDEETIAEDEEKINGGEKINDDERLEEGGDSRDECPEPSQSDEMCAQVIAWALGPEGQCCQYPTPCQTPEDWETFHSESDCQEAASSEDSTQ